MDSAYSILLVACDSVFVSDRVKPLDCGALAVHLASVSRCRVLAFLIRAPPVVAVCSLVRTGFMAEV